MIVLKTTKNDRFDIALLMVSEVRAYVTNQDSTTINIFAMLDGDRLFMLMNHPDPAVIDRFMANLLLEHMAAEQAGTGYVDCDEIMEKLLKAKEEAEKRNNAD